MVSELPERTNSLVLSFMSMRRAIGLSGILLPVVLGPIGWLVFGIEFQDNMSSYYHTGLRDVFVGTLCAIGIFLFCYRGYDWIEHWTTSPVPIEPNMRLLRTKRSGTSSIAPAGL